MTLVRDFRFLAFGCGQFYQRFGRKAITTVPLQRKVFEGLTPCARLIPGLPCQTTRHSHSRICAITSPNSSSAADQTSADTKFAIWNGQYDISKMPAASGTEARNGPKKQA